MLKSFIILLSSSSSYHTNKTVTDVFSVIYSLNNNWIDFVQILVKWENKAADSLQILKCLFCWTLFCSILFWCCRWVVPGFLVCFSEGGRQWMVCEGFQFILRNQANALVRLGVSPHFKVSFCSCWTSSSLMSSCSDGNVSFQDEVLCQLWRLYLQKSRQAYTNNPVRSSKFKLVSSEFLVPHALLSQNTLKERRSMGVSKNQ